VFHMKGILINKGIRALSCIIVINGIRETNVKENLKI
jgi:hypothetical protein